jgi:hypothetical protein
MNIENHFPFIQNKYLILYIDKENSIYENKLYTELKEKYNIIKFLLNSEIKTINSENIIEMYPDEYTEDILIKNCEFILYFSKIFRSNNLAELSNKYSKCIFLNNNILTQYLNNENINSQIINILYNDYIKFINNILEISNNQTIIKNINLECNKIFNEKNNNYKINLVTFYINHAENILNIIQKKCIIENLKNKFIGNLYIIGSDLNDILNDIYEPLNESEKNQLKIIENNNSSFYNILKFINNNLIDKTICITRSDIVLLNHIDLDDIHYELKNNIYTLSRIDRLITGEFIKYQKLNQLLFSTEQDAWIFKSPINYEFNELENIGLYDKYGELYFNNILKKCGYNLINTNKYKIIRVLHENNLDKRLLLNNNDLKRKINDNENILNEITLVPDNSIDNIPLDNLLKIFNIDDKELYQIKCDLFNKYYKKKIINEL